jgi:hypothetical protein
MGIWGPQKFWKFDISRIQIFTFGTNRFTLSAIYYIMAGCPYVMKRMVKNTFTCTYTFLKDGWCRCGGGCPLGLQGGEPLVRIQLRGETNLKC